MAWKALNPEESVSQSVTKVGIELLGQLKTGTWARSNVMLQREWDAVVSELNWDELILNK